MKKLIVFALVLVCALSLIGCDNHSAPSPVDANEDARTAFLRIDQQGELCDGYSESTTKFIAQFKSTEGPSEVAVEVWCKSNDGEFVNFGETVLVKVGETASFDIPTASDYVVKTTAVSGNDGNVTFLVSQED